MQKRSHKLLAHTLLDSCDGFEKKRFELAFLFGSFQPDCNPLTYFKGSIHGKTLMGHNFTNSQKYIDRHISMLQGRSNWHLWQYYTLGKLTHYLADAFTFPHNETYHAGIAAHRRYESAMRECFSQYLSTLPQVSLPAGGNVTAAIDGLHRQYLTAASDTTRDFGYILSATTTLMAGVRPRCAVSHA